MTSGTDDDRGLPEVLAAGMLEEARQSAAGESGEADSDLEPGVIADTGQPAGTADAHAAGVMDTDPESNPAAPPS